MIQQHGVTDTEILSLLAYVHGRLATETGQATLSVDLFSCALSHFKSIVDKKERDLSEHEDVFLSRLYSCLGNGLTTINRFIEAELSHETALQIALKIDESPSTRLGVLYANLGSCLLWKGDLIQAERLLHKALLQHDRGLECNLYALGNVYLRQGRLNKALEVHREVLQILSKSVGPTHHCVADSCHKIGSIYSLNEFENKDLVQAE